MSSILSTCPRCAFALPAPSDACPKCGVVFSKAMSGRKPTAPDAAEPTGSVKRDLACPKCGASTVQGQLVPQKDVSAGVTLALLTDDWAAGMLASQSSSFNVYAFCLTCGANWIPMQEYLISSFRGEHGETARTRARSHLEGLVERGSGFKLTSDEGKRVGVWARGVLGSESDSKAVGFVTQEGLGGDAFCVGCRTTGPRSQMLYNESRDTFYHVRCLPR